MSGKYHWDNYESICYHNKTYETADVTDNILENSIQRYETKVIPIINRILKDVYKQKDLHISKEEKDRLWQYMWLQTHRTDAGRLKLVSNFEGNVERTHPVELEEIELSKDKLVKFNAIFKRPEALDALVTFLKRPDSMHFHIAITTTESEFFITSDNPVVACGGNKGITHFQVMMPLSPFVYMEFQGQDVNSSDDILVGMDPKKIRYVNKANINTANYYVISHRPFNVDLTAYINHRFTTESWKPMYPFAPEK